MSSPLKHLAVVEHRNTGLFHGALYVNHPTPSGCDRYFLSKTTVEAYATERSAAIAINNLFPDVAPLDISKFLDETDIDHNELMLRFTKGVLIEVVRPKDKERPYIAIDHVRQTSIPVGIINKLEALGLVEFDSDSGDDPNLSARYSCYRVV